MASIGDNENGLEEEEEEETCKFCLKERSHYTCPRCNVRYCSLSCYKCLAHAQCSEAFYRDCFMEGLKDMKSTEDKAKVIDMLKRVAEEEEPLDSDDEDDDLHERMQGLDLDKDADLIWSRLTEREKFEFKAMIQDGRIGELVSPWQPWWCEVQKPALIQEVCAANDSGDSVTKTTMPPTLKDIPDFCTLLKGKPPAENLKYSIVNIIYGYAYISRLYNGDYNEYPDQSVQELLWLCQALGTTVYSNSSEAIQSCIQCLSDQARSLYVSRHFTVAIISDTQQIIHGPGPEDPLLYVMVALSEVHHMFTEAMNIFSQALKRKTPKTKVDTAKTCTLPPGEMKQLRRQCFAVIKKLEFFLSWVKNLGVQLSELEPMLQVEFCEMSSQLAAHKNTEEKLAQLKDSVCKFPLTKLIEDVTPPEK